jgi:hypothetical protein
MQAEPLPAVRRGGALAFFSSLGDGGNQPIRAIRAALVPRVG